MKTAISIPDDLFEEAEVFARRFGKSRSQLYREALAEYLLRRDPEAVTRAMDEALAQIDEPKDAWLDAAGRRVLERSEW
jgi:metal-responsive CopG/Arc/MetJ family transcriptional regulator